MDTTHTAPSPQSSPVPNTDTPKSSSTNFLEVMGKFNEMAALLRRERPLAELGMQLSQIAELAEATLTNEQAGHWMDEHTIRRNIKEMRNYAKEFHKCASEVDLYEQRLGALYDDMGRVLERYFNISDSPSTAQPMHENVNADIAARIIDKVIVIARELMDPSQYPLFDSLPPLVQRRVAWYIVHEKLG